MMRNVIYLKLLWCFLNDVLGPHEFSLKFVENFDSLEICKLKIAGMW